MWFPNLGSGANSWVSLGASIISLSMTLYFWFVKAKRESAQLRLDSVSHQSYIDLGRGNEETRWLQFQVAIVVVNNSVLPNAVLDIEVLQRDLDRKKWVAIDHVLLSENSTLPVNLPLLQTGLITVHWWQSFATLAAAEALEARDIASGYVNAHFPNRAIQVKVKAMQGKTFSAEVQLKNLKPPIALRRAA
jgi:hypothetical protein